MGQEEMTPEYRLVEDAHRTLGLWSIRRTFTFAFSAAVVLLVAAWFLLSFLLGAPSPAEPEPLETRDRLELSKLVFALVAGVGALGALVIAYRRQRAGEAAWGRVQAHVEYGQGVEMLGHDKAAVRLGGLSSLGRLAQDHPDYRQTVTDVVCSYLRMPFPAPQAGDERRSEQPDIAQDPELQVRLTAQRLLKRHLTTTDLDGRPLTYWDGVHLDLTGAQLIDFDFTDCRPSSATFTNAHFSGPARFDRARFSAAAQFGGARFSRYGGFSETQFGGPAVFDGACFSGGCGFDEARFGEVAWFREAQFGGDASFVGAQFAGPAWFDGARFGGGSGFDEVRFDGVAWFREAQFGGDTTFAEVRFGGDAGFVGARFGEVAWFGGAHFSGNARFGGTRFVSEIDFGDATASHPNDDHAWPSPWHAQAVTADTAQLIRES
ncbi:pentapeptide repeat-containing protein [Actinomadura livida]|uniref:pentapeptide repeat-containing protein n=1 Tax=Actinomadura livida TaxID=79909 RepID=UPI00167076D0|nr:pentapeptide repeat-containing protein [Actinomadura livida]